MSTTGLEAFDTTLQKTAVWLNEIMAELASKDRHLAYLALRATLHALRDRLTVEEDPMERQWRCGARVVRLSVCSA